mmetsp:Transcript_2365/g.4278  ORF Transcript_2365/g.4278 Transcript_2365/m.4278 type:complete len:267 (-) Transcript_2365:317-1117(-)|eukprot:CAMPEP_0197629960 /NCGR_PEP_ID=MMETSP1338-20131121/7603_1 /TAXON_ID=43686 ORGANISM="Pelagodinium beii, Strain RCC1491" /NCGR_SAMPLE_ID=MMETSP1338 /ASSEMBLY_ACC=CAM_ASM_000754 /LENGTH=266 /DNA_ID=CAMNT_0043201073 /DNA_START=45 /DNA_END=845 /DNA_ORIENTATION=-
MGVFTCTACKREYYDRRFLWESQKFTDSRASEVDLGPGERLVEFPGHIEEIGLECWKNPQNQKLVLARVTEGSWADAAGMCIGDEVVQVNGRIGQVSSVDDLMDAMQERPLSILFKHPERSDARDELHQYADVLRATGTTANITGTTFPLLATALGPVSAVGGICGMAGGISQLSQGLSLPSGHKDPHLIAKGAVTTGVGATCTTLGLLATTLGAPMLIGALCLGAVGLGTCTAIDASMDGICLECRSAQEDVVGPEAEVKLADFL